MLALIGDNTWNMLNMQHIKPHKKYGIIQTFPVVVLEKIKLIEAEWRIYALVNLSSLFQIMACRLIGAKPLSEPMLDYCQLDPCEHISMKI